MDITVHQEVVFKDAVKLNSVDEITEDCRVFYELCHKNPVHDVFPHVEKWIREGIFKEFENIELLKKDPRMKDESYRNHHNFVIVKNAQN